MGVSIRTVEWLRESGHDAVHVREYEMHRASDALILARGRSEGRIVLTMDLGFDYLLAISRQRLPSLIIFRLEDETSENLNLKLETVFEEFTDHLESGSVLSVGERRIRARRLPIQL